MSDVNRVASEESQLYIKLNILSKCFTTPKPANPIINKRIKITTASNLLGSGYLDLASFVLYASQLDSEENLWVWMS